MTTEKQSDFIKHMQDSVGAAYSIKAIFDNLDVDEIVEEIEKYKQQHIEDVCVGFVGYCFLNVPKNLSKSIKSHFQEYIKQISK